jgi:hypothetical protein
LYMLAFHAEREVRPLRLSRRGIFLKLYGKLAETG